MVPDRGTSRICHDRACPRRDRLDLPPAGTVAAWSIGSGQTSDSGDTAESATAPLLASGLGRALVILAGAAIITVGAYHVYKGATRTLRNDLSPSGDGDWFHPLRRLFGPASDVSADAVELGHPTSPSTQVSILSVICSV